VAAVGVPDPAMGEIVKACIALKAGETATEEAIKKFCAQDLADSKVPKFVEVMIASPGAQQVRGASQNCGMFRLRQLNEQDDQKSIEFF